MRWISAFEDRYLKPPILFQNNQIYLVMWSKDYSKQGPRILSCVRLSSDLLLQDIGEISDYEGVPSTYTAAAIFSCPPIPR